MPKERRKNNIRFLHGRNKPVQEFVINNFSKDNKIKEACSGLQPNIQWLLMELPREKDRELIADFILQWSSQSENGTDMSVHTKESYVSALVYLSRYLNNHAKSFEEMTREDIIDGYLASIKRDFNQDPDQKWVNTYINCSTKILAFWKWLTQPDLKREERQTPPLLKGLRFPKKKAKTSVKREHLWTAEEHKVFLDYCEDLRLACYHSIAKETGGRPSELLALKIDDIEIKVSPATGKKYAEVWIGRTGKMKKGRPVSIADSIPHLNVWTAVHPLRDKPQGAYLFPSRENRAKYRNVPLKPDSLRLAYARTIKQFFPLLLERPDVPLEDKQTIKTLLKKPFHPYLLRHEFATEIVHKVPQLSFNQLMGHSRTSKMYDVYVQDLGNEGNRELLISKGILTRETTLSKAQLEMQPKYCPMCRESNKQTADFCFKCNWVISKKGMQEVKEKDEKALREAEEQKKQMQTMAQELEKIKVELARVGKEADSWALQSLDHWTQEAAAKAKGEKREGRLPALRPIDTNPTDIDVDDMPPELLKLLSLPWDEIGKPEKRRVVYGLLRRKLQ